MTKSNDTTICATTLKTIIQYVGFDVHKDTIAVGVADEGQQPRYLKTISHDLHVVEKLIHGLRQKGKVQLKGYYEAGPTGFVLARRLLAKESNVWEIRSTLDLQMFSSFGMRFIEN